MDSPTVEDARRKKRDVESAIRGELESYEEKYEIEVKRVRLHRQDTTDGGSTLTSVELEVQL